MSARGHVSRTTRLAPRALPHLVRSLRDSGWPPSWYRATRPARTPAVRPELLRLRPAAQLQQPQRRLQDLRAARKDESEDQAMNIKIERTVADDMLESARTLSIRAAEAETTAECAEAFARAAQCLAEGAATLVETACRLPHTTEPEGGAS